MSQNLLTMVHNEPSSEVNIEINDAQVVCLTIDAWTSQINESYIAVTAQYIDAQTKLCSSLIDCKQYNERHTSENVCNFLKEIMSEWNISHKIATVVSNNTNNILVDIRLGERLLDVLHTYEI